MNAPVAALTGGTGFLGRYIAQALAAAGWHIRMLIRQKPDHPMLRAIPLEWHTGSLSDAASLARLVSGADVVIHAAGLVKALSRAEFMDVNRDGTGRLAEAVARAPGVSRLIVVSSLVARAPRLSAYAESKRAGEDRSIELLGRDRQVILRPSAIYGPWDYEGAALLRLAAGRFAPAVVAPEPRIAMLHARDAAAAILAATRPEWAPGCYELSDARHDGYGWRELLQVIGDALGRRPMPLPVPDSAFLTAGAISDGLAAVLRRPVIFGRGKAREILYRDWSVAADRQIAPSIWQPHITLEAGMQETAGWWREIGKGRS